MRTVRDSRISHWWATVLGFGVALTPIHNQFLTDLATNSNGEVLFFLPTFGFLLVAFFLLFNWHKLTANGWGDRRIVFCLVIIVAAIALSGTAYTNWQDRFAPLGMGLLLLSYYLAARVDSRVLFTPLAVGSAIASIGVVISAVTHPGQLTGGLVFERNYDIIVGYVLLGVAFYSGKWRLHLIALGLVAIFLTGSPEGVFGLSVLGLVVLIRKDWGKPLLLTVAPLMAVMALWFGLGWGQQLYSYAVDIVRGEGTVQYAETDGEWIRRDSRDPPIIGTASVNPLADRWNVIRAEMLDVRPLGKGYVLTAFQTNTVHNVPLIMAQQMGYPGILAGLAWLWVAIYCIRNTQRRYAWTLMLALSVFDHFTWTQMAPYWWLLVGTSVTARGVTDKLSTK